MLTIPNPERGCGQIKPGGVYLQADRGPGGLLASRTWVLGNHRLDAVAGNLRCQIPPRKALTIDPELSLDFGVVYLTGEAALIRTMLPAYAGSTRPQLARLGSYALIDHVGANNYTPWAFATELEALGPSRRVTPQIAAAVAGHLPCPVFFSHSDLPWLEDEAHALAFSAQVLERPLTPEDRAAGVLDATWNHPDWGMRVGQNQGRTHYLIPILQYLADQRDWHDLTRGEAVFCASWFTRAVYVLPDGEERLPPALVGSGIRPVHVATRDEGEPPCASC